MIVPSKRTFFMVDSSSLIFSFLPHISQSLLYTGFSFFLLTVYYCVSTTDQITGHPHRHFYPRMFQAVNSSSKPSPLSPSTFPRTPSTLRYQLAVMIFSILLRIPGILSTQVILRNTKLRNHHHGLP
jgi:hypothetical protein